MISENLIRLACTSGLTTEFTSSIFSVFLCETGTSTLGISISLGCQKTAPPLIHHHIRGAFLIGFHIIYLFKPTPPPGVLF